MAPKSKVPNLGNFLPAPGVELTGKDTAKYGRWGGVCLMTQEHNYANLIFQTKQILSLMVFFSYIKFKFIYIFFTFKTNLSLIPFLLTN